MPAPTRTTTAAAAAAPRVELDTEDGDFDLGYDPSSFEIKHSRPSTAHGKHSPDSPTLGAAHPSSSSSPTIAGTTWMSTATAADFGRQSRFVEGMAEPTAIASASTTTASPPRASNHIVNPATIPIRTSSSNAVVNGEREKEKQREGPTSPKSPKKHRSLGSVPEERRYSHQRAHPDERDWMAQGQQQRHTMNSQGQNYYSNNGNSNGVGRSGSGNGKSSSRNLNTYASTTFSQQPTLSPSAEPLARPGTLLETPHDDPNNLLASSSSSAAGPGSSSWSPEKENILKGPYDYLESHPGKDIRTQLITAFNAWLRVPAPSLAIITSVIGQLHTASLLVDDVEDSSLLRRGVPVAHSIFGVAQTINSANYVYFCALQELLKLPGRGGRGGGKEEIIRIYTEELLNLHRGQGMDLFWRDTLTCPSEDDYLEMVGNKTGGLFRLAIKLMCAESPSHNHNNNHNHNPTSETEPDQTDYIPLANTIGLLFQILDDYRNLSDTTYTANKGLCEDLTEGKFSFPVIHSIRSDPSNLVLINILKQKTADDEVKRYATAYMEGTGSFAYTRRVLRGLTRRAVGLVEEVERSVGVVGDGGVGGEEVRAILERLRVDRHSRASQSG